MNSISQVFIRYSSVMVVLQTLMTALNILMNDFGVAIFNGLVTGWWFLIYCNKDRLLDANEK